ncbi:hypothetical protein TrST_g4351 [Triparma strigata]|uniref:Clathrin heavy chain n=1 Tax=Triparma strigata TaxID=1606541 RepID=A0A9W7ELV3_9STRA|nr:hypothetical protein TrST_g4351 [Triparma strigata]
MANLPILFSEKLNLATLGVNPEAIKNVTCSMESDKMITVCEKNAQGQAQICMIDMENNNAVDRKAMAAEAAIMNPVSKIIALRAGQTLQIFNLELKARMKNYNMTEPVTFWRWATPSIVALITATAVYHWSIEGDSAPQKIFDRNAALGAGTQIINYQLSPDGKFCLLGGISQGAGGIAGTMQYYSMAKRISQVLHGHAGTFATITPEGRTDPAQVLIFQQKKPEEAHQLFVMEIGKDKDAPGGVFRTNQAIPMPQEAPNDFPVTMVKSPKHDVVFMISKMGYLFMLDIHTARTLYRGRISTDTVFVATPQSATGGILGVTMKKGQVLQIQMNEETLVGYIMNTLRDNQLAISLAGRMNLPGAEQLYLAEFDRLMASQDVTGAAKLAAKAPQGILRNTQTIQRFQQIPAQPGQPQPVFQYFTTLLATGKLNATESIELARPVLQQGRANLLTKWLQDDKLECSEQLGDLLATTDLEMALSVYLRANVPEKAINCFAQRGDFDKLVAYAAKVGFSCDYGMMLQQLMHQNPQGAVEFAKKLASAEGGPLIDVQAATDVFMSMNRVQECTAFLLEALKENKQNQATLQTKLLEMNLLGGSPQVADAIMQNSMFTHYDRQYIAKLCEKAGLFQRAAEHFTELSDIKRVMANTHNMNPEFVMGFFANLSGEHAIELLRELLGRGPSNLQLVVQICQKYNDQLGVEKCIKVFEDFKSNEGLYYYLGAIVNSSQEPDAHFKYIEAASKLGQFKEVERVCRDSTVYDAAKVKSFLMDAKLADPRPLIHVCDRNDFIDEMTAYLYSNNLLKYIEVYVQKVSPGKTPQVVGKLLELDCNEDFVRGLLNSVGQACPVDELVEQVERRNRLRLLQPWLEARVATGNTEPSTHNAIGKIYITLNRDPTQFLENNQFYEPAVLGKYCEKLDPSLAFLAYKKAGGACDEDLLRVTTDNGLFKDQARYLVEKQDLELWAKVLGSGETEEDSNKRSLIDQVVQTALPETKNPDEVSTTVKAFLAAELSLELIELLDRIILQGSEFSNNKNLQNLLILTAVKCDQDKVMEYINRLDNFDGPEIAKIAAGEQYMLYEEAFVIYQKFAKVDGISEEEKGVLFVSAVEVLVDKMKALERAKEFCERVSVNQCWSKLAGAQLSEGMIHDSIASYCKAKDASNYTAVIAAAEAEENYEDIVTYLVMARADVKENALDTALIYAYAKTGATSDLEQMVSSPNVANIIEIGERCFVEGLFDAAKLLFESINNNAKLALCYVNLGAYREAVDAATKANAISTWKEVNIACVKDGEFRLAAMCGLHIIVHPDHLEELINTYESVGKPLELITVMEQGLGLEGSHAGIFTELGVLYSKYNPDKLMEHIKIFWSRMNVPKLLRACETALLWDETVYLYKEDGQHDSAVKIMIDHASAFKHDLFLDCVQKARNQEVHYKSIAFYNEQHPLLLVRLLQVLTPSLDHARAVHMFRKSDALSLVMPYLKSVQKENLTAVNEAVNEILTEDEDYEALRTSIDEYDNFDQIALAQKLEKHELLEFRRIAAYVYKKNKRWGPSMNLSKQDKMYKDAIETSNDSGDSALVEELMRFFVGVQDKECFCAMLYTCNSLVKPDVAIELSWRNGYTDYAMPYLIQYVSNLTAKVKEIDERTAPKEDQVQNDAAAAAANMMYGDQTMMITNGGYGGGMDPSYGGMPQPGMMPAGMQQGGMGMGMQGGMPPMNGGGMY